jgi:hypothetical protein
MLGASSRIILDTLLPTGAHTELTTGILDAGFDEFWAEVERTALPAWRWGLRAAVLSANWVAPLLVGRLPPLTMHDRPTRERALAAMAASRVSAFRQMVVLLKTIAALCYGANPAVRAAIGYPRQLDDPLPKLAE